MDLSEQLNPTGRIDDRLDCLDHWTPPPVFYKLRREETLNSKKPSRAGPVICGAWVGGFLVLQQPAQRPLSATISKTDDKTPA